MDNLEPNEILKAPGVLMFFIFINTLISEKKAIFSENSNKVITLNTEASNYFILGRDDKMIPFIGIQEDMVPWFLEMPWERIALCPKDKHIYLIAEEHGEVQFILGLKPRAKRMITLFDPKKEKIEDAYLNLKIFKMIKKDIAVSHNNGTENLNISIINNVNDIIKKDSDKETFKEDKNDQFVIVRR
jgi:hypothetical protein